MIDVAQYRFRIGTYTVMGTRGSGRLNSGQFHDSSVFNPYKTSDTSSGFWMTNIMHSPMKLSYFSCFALVFMSSLEITWFSCPDRTLKIMSQIKFDFLNQLIARSAISLKIKYESQIKSLRKG